MYLFKKVASLVLALLIVAALPVQALAAEYDLAEGNVIVNATEGADQTVKHGEKDAVVDNAPVITQKNPETSTSNTITITGGGEANVTIKDVNINTSGAAFTVDPGKPAGGDTPATNGTSANVTLEGTNIVKSGSGHAGVEVAEGAEVTITTKKETDPVTDEVTEAPGSLTVTGGSYAAGIGGGSGSSNHGTTTITDSEVVIKGVNGENDPKNTYDISGDSIVTLNTEVIYPVSQPEPEYQPEYQPEEEKKPAATKPAVTTPAAPAAAEVIVEAEKPVETVVSSTTSEAKVRISGEDLETTDVLYVDPAEVKELTDSVASEKIVGVYGLSLKSGRVELKNHKLNFNLGVEFAGKTFTLVYFYNGQRMEIDAVVDQNGVLSFPLRQVTVMMLVEK